MEKKTITFICIFAVVIIAVFGVGLAAAYNGQFGIGFEKILNPRNLTQEKIQQMKDFNSQVQTAIKNNDFATWKSLMESQLTQDNFNTLVANYLKISQMVNQTSNKWHMPGNFTGNFTRNFTGNFIGNFTRGFNNPGRIRNMHIPA
jgi:hypothetical protein